MTTPRRRKIAMPNAMRQSFISERQPKGTIAEAYASVRLKDGRYIITVALRDGPTQPVYHNEAILEADDTAALVRTGREVLGSVLDAMKLDASGGLGPPLEDTPAHRRPHRKITLDQAMCRNWDPFYSECRMADGSAPTCHPRG